MSIRRHYTLFAAAYVLTIYTTSGWMRHLSTLARQIAGERLGVLVTLYLILILTSVLLIFRHALHRRHILPLLSVLLGYGLVLWGLSIPEERFHLLQYGLLCVLCDKALPDRLKGLPRHGLVILLVTLAGIGDELIQWLRPNRVGDIRDVLTNSIAALLAQALIAILHGGLRSTGRRNAPDKQTINT